MRTADFFSPESFADHLERRSSPHRWAILSILSLACLGTAWATEWQANREETLARDVARLDPDALRAAGAVHHHARAQAVGTIPDEIGEDRIGRVERLGGAEPHRQLAL